MIKFSKCLPTAMCEGCESENVPALRTATIAGGLKYWKLAAVVDLCGGCISGLGQASAMVCQGLQDEEKVSVDVGESK